ncbi:hypothetical protein NEOLEDRAFT_105837 [Neolentinus lepideus HHB14362 ss-1]|uniref:Uncharacterized protein n=1 Tax=Neolentinus lepideus HHB14362 ss-1 TaxID=1314782 RepID=A0A165U4H3_9AGAM|nr:hypothetical protein NEOLEDRAFT_105837 [Neolentinus lepideus HHB14362 ss-1]
MHTCIIYISQSVNPSYLAFSLLHVLPTPFHPFIYHIKLFIFFNQLIRCGSRLKLSLVFLLPSFGKSQCHSFISNAIFDFVHPCNVYMHLLHQSVNPSHLAFSPASAANTNSSFHLSYLVVHLNQVWIVVKSVVIKVPKPF